MCDTKAIAMLVEIEHDLSLNLARSEMSKIVLSTQQIQNSIVVRHVRVADGYTQQRKNDHHRSCVPVYMLEQFIQNKWKENEAGIVEEAADNSPLE
jgi:hypothetical protein